MNSIKRSKVKIYDHKVLSSPEEYRGSNRSIMSSSDYNCSLLKDSYNDTNSGSRSDKVFVAQN